MDGMNGVAGDLADDYPLDITPAPRSPCTERLPAAPSPRMDGMDIMDNERSQQQPEPLIPKHGGYRNLKSFRVAQLVYDVTVHFCDTFIDRRSRTHDQMVQAARSGVQNIAEGSQASATSNKTEMKLTNVARASLEELRLDYEDYLRQRGLELWPPNHPCLQRFKARRCATMAEVRLWLQQELEQSRSTDVHGQETTDNHRQTRTGRKAPSSQLSVSVSGHPCQSVLEARLMANAALSLLNVACHLLNRQLAAQAAAFERDGGFSERLYHRREVQRRL